MLKPLLLAGLLLVVAATASLVFAQSPECPPSEAPHLSMNDPIYADAMDLQKRLEENGFVVHCIFPTKLGSIFQVEENGVSRSTIAGEANFRTDYGDIDVVFLPKAQTFAGFKISEHREGGAYLYQFSGTPRVWSVNKFGTALRSYFLKQDNHLFFVSDKVLRDRLEHALHLPAQTL